MWQDKVISGSFDDTIRVWGVSTGELETTLSIHTRTVTALLVHGDFLFSASDDGTIQKWAAGAWGLLQTVEAADGAVWCLAVSGSNFVSGSWDFSDHGEKVQVWSLETLACEHTLPQRGPVRPLMSVRGKVWGGVGKEVVVWGRA